MLPFLPVNEEVCRATDQAIVDTVAQRPATAPPSYDAIVSNDMFGNGPADAVAAWAS